MGKMDVLLKSYLGDARRYADLWNGGLFCGRQIVKAEELEEIPPDSGSCQSERGVGETARPCYEAKWCRAAFRGFCGRKSENCGL